MMAQPALNPFDALLSPHLSWLFQQPQRLGKASGWWGHVPFAQWLVDAAQPRLLVELGTHHGVSYAALCEAVKQARLTCQCFAVDHWQGDAHAGHVDEQAYVDLLNFNQAHYGSFSELLRADFSQALGRFADSSIDLLHIDGFHTYEAVLRDYQQWQPKLSNRAVVLLHDTNVHRDGFGIQRLFGELARRYPHFEFPHSNGLGLIAHGSQVPEAVLRLCTLTGTPEACVLRERFAAFGARWESHATQNELARSFTLQVDALERERVLAGQQQADAEAQVAALAGQLHVTESELAHLQDSHAASVRQLERITLERTLAQNALQNARRQEEQMAEALNRSQQAQEQAARESTSLLAAMELQARRQIEALASRSLPHVNLSRLRRLQLLLNWRRVRRNPIADVVRRSALFDAPWYLGNNDDVARAGIEPAFHYAVHGGLEGRDPSPCFSSLDYLRQNPDVARAGINPLYHYEMHGRAEGRSFPLKSLRPHSPPAKGNETAFREQGRRQLETFLAGNEALTLPTTDTPLVSIILVLHNQAELTFICLQALRETLDVPAEIIIVDNASSDQTQALLSRLQGCRLLPQTENLHFLRAANLAAAQAKGRHLLFLNNDTRPKPGAIQAAVNVFETRTDAGAVGGKLIRIDGTLQEAGSIIWSDGSCQGYGRGQDPQQSEFQFQRDVDYCSGAFLMVPRGLFEKLSGFDPVYAPAYYEEADFCMRLRRHGHAVIYEPRAEIVHVEFGSSPSSDSAMQLMQDNRKTFLARHHQTLNEEHLPSDAQELQARMRPRRRHHVLLIDDQIPVPSWGSGYPRAREMLRSLQALGVFVTVLPLAAGQRFDFEEAYAELPRDVEIAASPGRAGLASFLRSRKDYYDTVVISRPHNMEALLEALEHDPELLGRTRLIYDAEAIFAQREALKAQVLGQATAQQQNEGLAAELRLARPAHTIFTVNRAEAQHFVQSGYADVRVLGHSITLQPTPQPHEARQSLLFVGRLSEDDSPNADSIRWFVQAVMPHLDRLLGKDYRLNIVGGCSHALRSTLETERIRFLGRVPDIRSLYATSRLFIAPTRFSAGIPLKIYEAAAHGLPVVATSLLREQLGWSDGHELLSADSAEAFAQACASLYLEPQLWDQIRHNALDRVGRDCSPQRFRHTLQGILSESMPSLYAPRSAPGPVTVSRAAAATTNLASEP